MTDDDRDLVMHSARIKRNTRTATAGLAPRLGMSVAQFTDEALQEKIERHVLEHAASRSSRNVEEDAARLIGLANEIQAGGRNG